MKIEHIYPSCTFQEFLESNDLTLQITHPLTPDGGYKASVDGLQGGCLRSTNGTYRGFNGALGESITSAVQSLVLHLRDFKDIFISDPAKPRVRAIRIPQKLRVPPNNLIVAWAKSSEREQEARVEELKKEANE